MRVGDRGSGILWLRSGSQRWQWLILIGSDLDIRELEKEVEIYSHIATKENLLKSVGHLGKGSQPELHL